ncbi:MAG: methionyl aminopeptidase [Candidatus Woesearchaeota archaeon]|nr:methionyl aminopeptidase [Candidatus Woesearchaeota archaeon]
MSFESKEYDDWIKAGEISAKALAYGKSLIKPGAKIREILDAVDNFIIEQGAIPAFPSQISVNSFAAHYCSDNFDETIITEKDVVKLDVGACYNGALGDNAITINLSGEHSDLLDASRQALNNVINIIKPGITLSEIGKVIEKTIEEKGFSPIRNLSGHSLSLYKLHSGLSVPNYDTGSKITLEKGMIVAIEPFATNGFGLVVEKGVPNVFMQFRKRNVRHPFASMVLKEIKKYKGLPFARRWLEKKFRKELVNQALDILVREDIIVAFPPLVEKNQGLVSQFEHTILVWDKAIVTTKLDDLN